MHILMYWYILAVFIHSNISWFSFIYSVLIYFNVFLLFPVHFHFSWLVQRNCIVFGRDIDPDPRYSITKVIIISFVNYIVAVLTQHICTNSIKMDDTISLKWIHYKFRESAGQKNNSVEQKLRIFHRRRSENGKELFCFIYFIVTADVHFSPFHPFYQMTLVQFFTLRVILSILFFSFRRLEFVPDFAVQFYRNLVLGFTIFAVIVLIEKRKSVKVFKDIGKRI